MFITEVVSFQNEVPVFQEFVPFLEDQTKLSFKTKFEIDTFRIETLKNNWVVAGYLFKK